MDDSRVITIAGVVNFLNGSGTISFGEKEPTRVETYMWIEETLQKFSYVRLKRKDRGWIKRYVQKMTGYSRAQVTRLVAQFIAQGHIHIRKSQRHTFIRVYSNEDVALLAKTDALHDYPNGAALKKILKRMAGVYKANEYGRIANISVTHIYNLRRSPVYLRMNTYYEKTKPVISPIGERKKPEPNGKAGYVRVDTVHQGDKERDGRDSYEKGVYHINMIDEVTQFEFVGSVEKISEAYLSTLLEHLLLCFPFKIIEFHSDNGSEYINGVVVQLLNKLLIRLTKSRSRKSNDNALVEGKNGSIIRKWMGYGYIEQKHAERINQFYFNFFNEYLNYHRPCAFATEIVDRKGKVKKIYKPDNYMTPFEKLKSLPKESYALQKGVTFTRLNSIAMSKTDNQMAHIVQEERRKLFEYILPVSL